ncbi:CdaR family protein [Desulfonatronospira sp.]|uniref:CdaR family protein n=1 Tax=Desulfonatronospira sp. TaxID=1962951 RepID=UPI0025C703B3|nr:CdaR family protein [Desulfonatronospira sp.]
MFKANWQYRILALVMAVFFWYLISGQEKVDMWVEVPVEVSHMPGEYTVTSGMVSKVTVRCRATKTMLGRMDISRLAYNLDLSGLEQGENTIVLDPKRINLPRAVQAVEITPSRLELEVDRFVIRDFPVQVSWTGAVSPHYQLREKVVQPDSVRVRGPQRILNDMDGVETKPLAVDEYRPGTVQRRVRLNIPPELESTPADVRVELVFGPVLEDIWVRKPIEVRGAQGVNYSLDQDHARAYLSLPRELLQEDGWRERLHYYVQIQPGTGPGVYELPVDAQLPEYGQLLEMRPEKVELTIE